MTRALWILVCVGLAACAGILGLRDNKLPATFPHRAHVVRGVSCTTCHPGVATSGPGLHLPSDATCTTSGCHAKPHDTRSCTGCHGSQAVIAELVATREHLIFDHAKHQGASQGNCMQCHDGVAGSGALRPPMATCFRCHDDLEAARRCDRCHDDDLAEKGTLPQSHLVHDGDWIREHGARASSSGDLCETCHKQAFCASCHGATVPVLPAERRFADPFRANIHRAGFAGRHALEARSDPGACQTCHSPDRCITCHSAKGIADGARGNPHPAGWLGLDNLHGREARRDPASCASCHGGAGEQLCVGCHAVGGIGGNPHPPGWSSSRPLSAMPCRLCHPLGARQ